MYVQSYVINSYSEAVDNRIVRVHIHICTYVYHSYVVVRAMATPHWTVTCNAGAIITDNKCSTHREGHRSTSIRRV